MLKADRANTKARKVSDSKNPGSFVAFVFVENVPFRTVGYKWRFQSGQHVRTFLPLNPLSLPPLEKLRRYSDGRYYDKMRLITLCPRKTCDYIFWNNLNNKSLTLTQTN